MTDRLFLPYKLSQEIKTKGFDEPCFGFYNYGMAEHRLVIDDIKRYSWLCESEYCLAPLYQQALDWLRDKHNIDIVADLCFNHHPRHHEGKWHCEGYEAIIWKNKAVAMDLTGSTFDDYYKLLNFSIEEALKLI